MTFWLFLGLASSHSEDHSRASSYSYLMSHPSLFSFYTKIQRDKESSTSCYITHTSFSPSFLSSAPILRTTVKMHTSQVSAIQNQEAESEGVFCFDKSLKELKALRSQLHYAADYCEATFLKTEEKTHVVENTKEYVCRALVTVVDHLGTVSANLDHCIDDTNGFTDAELRINSLKQRLLSCEKYAHKLALNRISWSVVLPRYHRRYLSDPITNVDKPSSAKITSVQKCGLDSALALPVRDGMSTLSKRTNPTFHFQMSSQKPGRKSLHRRSLQSNEIMSLIRRIKQTI